MNPDESGTPLPTTLRILQLNSVAKLREAEFEALVADPEAALGDELLGAQELTLFPNEPSRLPIELDPEARYLVAVAVVRRPAGSMWRSLVVLPAAGERCDEFLEDGAPDPAIVFRVQDYRVSATSHLGGGGDSTLLPDEVAR